MSTYRIARMEGRHVAAQYDFDAATLGEAFEQARVWWHLSHTDHLRCLGTVMAPLPRTQTVTPVATVKPFDVVGFVMDYESGELDEDAVIDGFQHLVDSGLAWQLQGSYGRTAHALIEAGVIHA